MMTIEDLLATAREHHQAGRFEDAQRAYEEIIAAVPDHPEALYLLGLLAHQQGENGLAIQRLRRVIQLDGGKPHVHNNLGELYRRQGQLCEAVACFQKALELKPDYEQAHNNLGNALADQGDLDAAIACYQEALSLKPDYADAHNNLGNALARRGNLESAVACYQSALTWKPDSAEAYNGLGSALESLGRQDEAIDCLQRALRLKPDYALAHNNLGITLRGQGRLEEAIACGQRAVGIRPDLVEGYIHLASVWREQGKLEEAIAGYQRALMVKPDSTEAHSGLLSTLQYRAGVTLSALNAAHAEYDRRHAAPLRAFWRAHENRPDPGRRLRLGFVSPDFGFHPVSLFLIRVLENLDRRECEVVCYSDANVADEMTARIQRAATLWHDVLGMTHQRLAEQIRADRIDILFDLAGHTPTNRLPAFARKPAPIQITWIGYEGTTGLAAMDYLLADRYVVPPGAEPYYCERILRMPDGYLCFDPPAYAPPVGPLPACGASRGTEFHAVRDELATDPAARVTFASFNNPAKITPQVVACWAQILHRLPQARLLLKYRGLDDAATGARFHKLFAEQGIAPARVELLGSSPHADALALYNQVDVALDTFPFSGSATTCDALWMGVPLVTCPGETFASRHGLSHLSVVGLPEMIAQTLEDYVDRAVALAGDLPRLAAIRAGLRQCVARSPLCDGERFARNLLDVLRRAWGEWCKDRGATAIPPASQVCPNGTN